MHEFLKTNEDLSYETELKYINFVLRLMEEEAEKYEGDTYFSKSYEYLSLERDAVLKSMAHSLYIGDTVEQNRNHILRYSFDRLRTADGPSFYSLAIEKGNALQEGFDREKDTTYDLYMFLDNGEHAAVLLNADYAMFDCALTEISIKYGNVTVQVIKGRQKHPYVPGEGYYTYKDKDGKEQKLSVLF